MSLKDFSFAQLDKSARLSVGKTEEKSDKKDSVVYIRCNVTGSCRHAPIPIIGSLISVGILIYWAWKLLYEVLDSSY